MPSFPYTFLFFYVADLQNFHIYAQLQYIKQKRVLQAFFKCLNVGI